MTEKLTTPALLLLITTGLAGCQGTQADQAPLPSAVVVTAETAPAEGEQDYAAHTEARNANDLAFRVAGKVIERRVHPGDTVHKGQILARLDAADAQWQLNDAAAGLAGAEHRLQFAQQQLQRDQAQAALKLIATAQLEQSQNNLAQARAARDQASSQWQLHKRTLDYQLLRADQDGVISGEMVDTGAVVSAGQAVYRLNWNGANDVIIDVPPGDIGRIKAGQQAEVRLTDRPAQPALRAQVREIAAQADALSGSFRVKLGLSQAYSGMVPGLSARARLLSGQASTLIKIPASALFHQGNRPAVWVLHPNTHTLALRPVTPARYEENAVILAAGLQQGEQIVAAGTHTVYAGEKIRPVAPLFSNSSQQRGEQ
jgi:multidrug efflux system membrane fusion protein